MKRALSSVLVLGFSVTADRTGFAPLLQERMKDCDVTVCGLGGFHPIHLAYFIEHILGDKKYDLVVLDIDTAAWRRPNFESEDYDWPVRYIVEAIRRKGAKVLLVQLPRRDVDYSDDIASHAIDRVASANAAQHLRLASDFYAAGTIDEMLKDEVHATGAASTIYADLVEKAIRRALKGRSSSKRSRVFSGAEFGFRRVAQAASIAPDNFERTGFSCDGIKIREGQSQSVDLGAEAIVSGALVVIGPTGGWLTLDGAEVGSRRFLAYDKHSYYERFVPQQLTPMSGRTFVASVEAGTPDVALIKGSKNDAPREVMLAGLLVSREDPKVIAESAKAAVRRS